MKAMPDTHSCDRLSDERALDEAMRWDLIVVGGGIYGAMAALEATRRGYRPLLLERDDFGSATTHNNLRIVHGGLRYLQHLDLPRHVESVGERRWFLRFLDDLVLPLPCVMPLDNRGLHRPSILRLALWLNDLFSATRNKGVRRDRVLPRGRVLGESELAARFPALQARGATGAALWYDAFIPNVLRIAVEVLRWAVMHGAVARNYVKVVGLWTEKGRLCGVRAHDDRTGKCYSLRTTTVINAAGPWCREVGAWAGGTHDELFRPSLAWNILIDRPGTGGGEHALALKGDAKGQVFFFVPWKGRVLAGTAHSAWSGDPSHPYPSREQLLHFLEELNRADPTLELREDDVLRVFSGLLPARQAGTAELSDRGLVIDHGKAGGVKGVYSLSGVKFTTARRLAEHVIEQIFPGRQGLSYNKFPRPKHPESLAHLLALPFDWMPSEGDDWWLDELERIAHAEGVLHLDDLLLRRTTLGDNPKRALAVAPAVCDHMGWVHPRRETEIERVAMRLRAGMLDAPAPL